MNLCVCSFPIGRVIPEAVTTVFVGGLPTLPYHKSLARALFFSLFFERLLTLAQSGYIPYLRDGPFALR